MRKNRKRGIGLGLTITLGAITGLISIVNSGSDNNYNAKEVNTEQTEKNQIVEVFTHPATGQPLTYDEVYKPFIRAANVAHSPRDFGSELGWEAYLYQEHRKDYFGEGKNLPRYGQFMNIREFERLRAEFIKRGDK